MGLRTHLPEDEYLRKIGLLAYLVSSLEGLLLLDLPLLADHLPPELNVESLAGQTTHKLGEKLVTFSAQCSDQEVRRYLEAGGRALQEVAPQRNAVFHARPAMNDQGRTQLFRWRLPESHFIDEAWLDRVIARVDDLQSELNDLRPILDNS